MTSLTGGHWGMWCDTCTYDAKESFLKRISNCPNPQWRQQHQRKPDHRRRTRLRACLQREAARCSINITPVRWSISFCWKVLFTSACFGYTPDFFFFFYDRMMIFYIHKTYLRNILTWLRTYIWLHNRGCVKHWLAARRRPPHSSLSSAPVSRSADNTNWSGQFLCPCGDALSRLMLGEMWGMCWQLYITLVLFHSVKHKVPHSSPHDETSWSWASPRRWCCYRTSSIGEW